MKARLKLKIENATNQNVIYHNKFRLARERKEKTQNSYHEAPSLMTVHVVVLW